LARISLRLLASAFLLLVEAIFAALFFAPLIFGIPAFISLLPLFLVFPTPFKNSDK
jgi:hypothetical protein